MSVHEVDWLVLLYSEMYIFIGYSYSLDSFFIEINLIVSATARIFFFL